MNVYFSYEEGNMEQYKMFINGEFIDNGSRKMIQVINPATEEVLSEIPEGTVEDVEAAVDAAYEAQKAWEKKPAVERAAYLHQFADLIRKNGDHLVETLIKEQGKTQALATVEIYFTADYFDYMAEFARRIKGEILESDRPNEQIYIHKAPIGVAAGILPWNFPFFLIARKMAPALVTGNTIVIKPSTDTPNNAFEFAKLVAQTDLPKGVFNLVTGRGGVVGHAMAGNPKVGIVSLTGSVDAGIKIMEAAAPNITKVSLELGGKAPAIVMEDADLELAADSIYNSRVNNSGQVCNNAERIYVHESVYDDFLKIMVEKMKNTRVGDPMKIKDLDMGPQISLKQVESIQAAVDGAIAEGAKCVLGGHRMKTEKGFFFEPTVLVDCKQSMKIMHEEIFGPVLPIATFKDFEEALGYANDCDYGLTSSIYTQNLDIAMRASKEIKFGETYINRENFECMQGFHAGCRKSGIGGADGSHGLEEYLQTHVVYIDYDTGKKNV
jgi:lactaldehyde dehydrogenase/glycolaldehyde dehydrogenase